MKPNLKNLYQIVTAVGEIKESSLGEICSTTGKTILYVYPRDNTPGCTMENKDFSCMASEFEKLGVQLIGLSQDTVQSHQEFISDHSLSVNLMSDPDLILHRELGAYGEKNNYGKIVNGVIRSTFLFDREGNLMKEWKNVKATGHVEKILKELQK